MKRKTDFLIVALFAIVLFTSCERVAPPQLCRCPYGKLRQTRERGF